MGNAQVKQGYKVTELGVIPEDWDIKKLEDLTPRGKKYTIVDGPFGSNLKSIHYRKKGIPIISSGFVTSCVFKANEYIFVEEQKFKQEIRSAVYPGEIVMAKIGARCGSSAIFPENHEVGILSGNALKISIDEDKHSVYFIWKLLVNLYNSSDIESITTTGAQPAISLSNLKKYLFPIPPLPEQKAIAAALSDVDALITAQEALIAKKRDIKTATMQQLLTGKVRLGAFGQRAGASRGESEDGVPPGYQQTELGVIPEDWKIEEIKNLANITTGSKNTQDKIESGKYPFFVRSQTVERINSYSFDGEAVLTAGDGVGTGKIFHYIDGKFDFHQRVYKISHFNELLDGFYFYTVFSNRFYDRIMSMTAKSSVDSVRMEMIADMLIPLPPVQEQKAIAEVLSDMDAEITALEAQCDKTRAIKQGMMQELLTGKTRLI